MYLREIHPEVAKRDAEYNAEHTTDERRLELESELAELDMTLEDKASSYADLMAHYDSDAKTIKAEISRLAVMLKRAEHHSGWLYRTLESQLLLLNRRKIDTGFWKFSFRRSESMVIQAGDAIPGQFMIPIPATTEPDNAAIKKALQEKFDQSKEWYGDYTNDDIPGAVLVVKQGLQIK